MNHFTINMVLLLSICGQAFGQTCDNFDPNTFSSTTAFWDWRDGSENNWESYVTLPTEPFFGFRQLYSPFQPLTSPNWPNINHLFTLIPGQQTLDFNPEDGWELVYKNFGGPSQQEAIDNPTYVLYNRFRGVLRVFLFTRKDPGELLNSAALRVHFSSAFSKETALLTHLEPIAKALDDFETGRSSDTPNNYSNTINGEWLHADFPVAYDPCTCEESRNSENVLGSNLTSVVIFGQLIKNVNITLEGITQALTEPIVANGTTNTSNDFISSIKGTADGFSSAAKTGTKTHKSINDLISGVATISANIDPNVKGEKVAKEALPTWMKALPEVGRYFSFFDFLITGGKSDKTAKETPPATPMQSKFTGILEMTGDIAGVQFYTPGSDQTGASPTIDSPTYNYRLGIFNLLETPVLEFALYETGLSETLRANGSEVTDPDLKQYHLKEPIKFAINPASELELVDLELAIAYRIGPNNSGTAIFASAQENDNSQIGAMRRWYGPAILKPTDPSLNYVDRMAQNGIVVDSWPKDNPTDAAGTEDIGQITHSTGFVPFSCIDNQSVLLSSWDDDGQGGLSDLQTDPKFALKVKAIFKRTDQYANSSTEPVLFLASYDMKVEETPVHTGNYGLPIFNDASCVDPPLNTCKYLHNYHVAISNPHFSLGTNGMPLTLKVDNVNITSDIDFQAVQSIEIGPNVAINPGVNVGFFAGREIDVDPGSIGVLFNNNVVLDSRNFAPFDCAYDDPLPSAVSQVDIRNNFCHVKDKYDPNVRKKQDRPQEITESSFDDTFEVFPNPTNDQVTLRYFLMEPSNVEVWLSDIAGKRIQTFQKPAELDAGEQTQQFSVQTVAGGLYFVNVRFGDETHVQKLIVQGN